jgi:signal transduction histidine kinase
LARVLLIDDEPSLRELQALMLAEAGHDVVEAGSGAEGIEAARRERPDLVVCDVNMPGVDGYAVLEALRADPQLSSTPFLFLTGLGDWHQVRAGMTSGADDYLTKPISPKDLIAAVEARLLRRVASQQETEERVQKIRSSLAALLPHELRTPLTAILGCARMLQGFHQEMPPEQIGEMATAILKAAQRLHRTAENYILHAHLEMQRLAGDAQPGAALLAGRSGPGSIREVARGLAAEFGREADLSQELAELELPIAAAYLEKITTELVDNAFKFSEPGTPVRLSLQKSDAALVFEVQDAGRGMTSDQLREVGAFRQFDRDRFEQQGSGLGLFLARRLVEGSRGRLEVSSSIGQGTRVRAVWPT